MSIYATKAKGTNVNLTFPSPTQNPYFPNHGNRVGNTDLQQLQELSLSVSPSRFTVGSRWPAHYYASLEYEMSTTPHREHQHPPQQNKWKDTAFRDSDSDRSHEKLCEIDLNKVIPPASLAPFMDEIKKRENQRKRIAKKEEKDKVKADAAVTEYYYPPVHSSFMSLSCNESHFSLDDFEENSGALSFANIISRDGSTKVVESPKVVNDKGNKASRVLLSTAGGRRY